METISMTSQMFSDITLVEKMRKLKITPKLYQSAPIVVKKATSTYELLVINHSNPKYRELLSDVLLAFAESSPSNSNKYLWLGTEGNIRIYAIQHNHYNVQPFAEIWLCGPGPKAIPCVHYINKLVI
jgi:hypothetical protein